MQIVSIAALQALLDEWRRDHGEATGCWIRSEEMQMLVYRIANLIQQPAPGEKIYRLCDEPLENIDVSRKD